MHEGNATLRVLLVDDHDVVREGLALLLSSHPQVTALSQASNGLDALNFLSAHPEDFDMLVTDLQMPQMGGLELIRHVRPIKESLAIIALTVDGQAATVAEALDAGAQAYLLKNSSKALLFQAISEVLAGRTFVDHALSGDLISYMRQGPRHEDHGLSPRELEVLRCIAEELNNEQIADRLFISERTVETHRKNIFRKTGAKSLVGLVLMAREKKLI